MRCIRLGGGDITLGLSPCRRSDLEGPVSPLDGSVARCPDPDGLRVSLQRWVWGSCVVGSGQRRTMRGVGEMIWRVAEN